MDRILRLVEVALIAPLLVVAVAHREVEAAGVVTGVAQAHGGFLQEAVEDGESGVVIAAGGREHVAVADLEPLKEIYKQVLIKLNQACMADSSAAR